MGDYDRRSRQSDARVQLGNLRVVPLCHFAQEYVGEQAAGKPELAGFDSVQIENRNDATNDQGKLQSPSRWRSVGFRGASVAAKSTVPDLRLEMPSARPNALISETASATCTVVGRPLGENWSNERLNPHRLCRSPVSHCAGGKPQRPRCQGTAVGSCAISPLKSGQLQQFGYVPPPREVSRVQRPPLQPAHRNERHARIDLAIPAPVDHPRLLTIRWATHPLPSWVATVAAEPELQPPHSWDGADWTVGKLCSYGPSLRAGRCLQGGCRPVWVGSM